MNYVYIHEIHSDVKKPKSFIGEPMHYFEN